LIGVKVRLVSDGVIDINDMPPGSTAIVCDDDGRFGEDQITELEREIERAGSTAAMLAAEAWKISSWRFKEALVSALGKEDKAIVNLLDDIVKAWGEGAGASYRSNCDVKNEGFDFTVAAFLSFASEPGRFGWERAPTEHKTAVERLRRPIRSALESETPGVWAREQPDVGEGEGFAMEDAGEEPGNKTDMKTRMFNILTKECVAALKVRQARNHGAGHPLSSSDADTRACMHALYRRAVAAKLPILEDFLHLAKVSLKHVEHELDEQARKEAARDTRKSSKIKVVQL
jgi:hypothetical protein